MRQSKALEQMKAGHNVFLTGAAGSGKSYVLRQFIEWAKEQGKTVAVTASTGIAATHIGGQTIHSWSGVGIKQALRERDLEKIAKKKPKRQAMEKAHVLIIDEVSMLSGSVLGCVNEVLKYCRVSWEPFGGVQLVLCGDFFQLPPVSREPKPSRDLFAFMHGSWVEAGLKVCYLKESFRQEEGSTLMDVLDEIRMGEISEVAGESIGEKLQEAAEAKAKGELKQVGVKLLTHNADVDKINEKKLEELEGREKVFQARVKGDKQMAQMLKNSVLAPEDLYLKVGAPVMFVKNNPGEGYVNGTLGEVVDWDEEGWPVVETRDGETVVAEPMEWRTEGEAERSAKYIQVPLRLAWAMTIHKSQGMTLEAADIDLSKTFVAGQGYVALSRVKSWEGLTLRGCNPRALMVDPLALKADRRFQELSAMVETENS